MRTGVYAIVQKSTKRIYIGSATDIDRRWSVHRHSLKNNSHHCIYLQRIWNKSTESDFQFQILLICKKHKLQKMEQQYMDKYKKPQLLNCQPIARSCSGFKHTKKTIQKMCISAKRASNTPAQRKLRSERAKQQWLKGSLGRKPKIFKRLTICKNCNCRFFNIKRPDGSFEQRKLCKKCKKNYKYSGFIGKHSLEAKKKISKASIKYWKNKKANYSI